MTRAYNISFNSLMSAGYISPAAYHVLYPKTNIRDLTIEECDLFTSEISRELRALFEDKIIAKNIYYLEKIEDESHFYDSRAYLLLEEMLQFANPQIKAFISEIGKGRFIRQYIYCTDKVLKELTTWDL